MRKDKPVNSNSVNKGGEACNPLVLIAGENPLNMRLACDILHSRGYRTLEITNGRRLFEAVNHHKPDLILIDIQISDLTYVELVQKINGPDEANPIPLFAITDPTSETEKKEIIKAGFVECVIKPVSVRTLLDLIERVLAKARKYAIA